MIQRKIIKEVCTLSLILRLLVIFESATREQGKVNYEIRNTSRLIFATHRLYM
ncbi:unnamed protein product [Hymenolepis diminuta]|uniref:Uncharacterized protein n=1 Tax=Hymenolepis diminuta TaxID=6216 RepID=A0A564Y430_HYMDI|nr:unnamed protein product [Hymenolepis diminuta]